MSAFEKPVAAEGSEPPERARRISRRAGRVPSSLALLLAVVTVTGLCWALIVPPWQAPDEPEHFAYAQSLATRFALPGGGAARPVYSTDQVAGDKAVGATKLAFAVNQDRPDWNAQDFARYLTLARRHPSPSDGGGPSSIAVNPPLFYLFSDLAYWASGSANVFGRLYAMRIWGVLLLLVNGLGGWLLAGEVLGRSRLAQTVCAGVCGLLPEESFISTSVTPDALLVTLWTLALWLGARVIRRGAQPRDATALCAVTAAAILTKATSYALVPATLTALVLGGLSRPAAERRAASRTLPAAVAALVVPVVLWLVLNRVQGRPAVNAVQSPAGHRASPFSVRQFISYVWQFYLPRLPSMIRSRVTYELSVYYIWLREGWGVFGWLDVTLPSWVYAALAAVSSGVAVAAGAIIGAGLRRRPQRELLGFFAVALLTLLFGLHLTEYRSLIAGEGPLLQGRYLLPTVGLLGLAVALIVKRAPLRWRGIAAGVILSSLLLAQVLSLAAVTRAYYT